MTHAELVEAARAWLVRQGYTIVITELATQGEEPDAIGFAGRASALVECKVSLNDLRADPLKPFRQEGRGVGQRRYLCVPSGLVKLEDLPETYAKWGFLEWSGKRMRARRDSACFRAIDRVHEVEILCSTLRRVAHTAPRGVSCRCYTIENQNRATVGLQPSEIVPAENPNQMELPFSMKDPLIIEKPYAENPTSA
jgi:hypothetical protein